MNTDLKARAEALLAALKVDGFKYIAGRPLDDLPWIKEALAAFMEAADAATVLNLIRERDEAREERDLALKVIREPLEGLTAKEWMDEYFRRHKEAFQHFEKRVEAEAALSAAREEVERLKKQIADMEEAQRDAADERRFYDF